MRNIIKVENLTKKFDDFFAVSKISFEVEEGDIFAFLGPNGAGKSTTIKMLTTLLEPTEGKIIINGFDVRKNSFSVRKSFGIVFQDYSLDDELTAWENMELHCSLYKILKKDRKLRIKKMLKVVDLEDKKDMIVKKFSGGMKRRLEIARAFLHYPKIFFLDEPTIGLDPQTRNNIWNYIKTINRERKTTIFFTTHYMEEAEKMAKKIAIIDKGKIIKRGSVSEIKKQTDSKTLEEAFILLTGKNIREEKAESFSKIRKIRRR